MSALSGEEPMTRDLIAYLPYEKENTSKRIRMHEPLSFLRDSGMEIVGLQEFYRLDNGSISPCEENLERLRALWLFITDVHSDNWAYMAYVLKDLRRRGIPAICDTDDHYFTPVPDNKNRDALSEGIPFFEKVIRGVQLVTVTGRVLREEMLHYNPSVLILPNLIDPRQYPQRPARGGAVRIGWTGGNTHLLDLAMVLPAIQIVQERTDAEFVLFGLYGSPIQETVEHSRALREEDLVHLSAFDAAFVRMSWQLDRIRYEHRLAVPYEAYASELAEADLDIGICPIRDVLFNRCRSAIKYYQYAAVGTVTLASHVYPYAEECNCTVENTTEAWADALTELVLDAQKRRKTLLEQRRYVLRQRTFQAGAAMYRAMLEELGKIVPGSGDESEECF